MGERNGENGDSHSTTVKYNGSTKEFLERAYPDALNKADAFRHAVDDARNFNEMIEEGDLDGADD